jgi:hypothetical protein
MPKKDKFGHEIKTQGEIARMVLTGIGMLIILGLLIGAAYFADMQFHFRRLLGVPRQVPDIAIPIAIGVILFFVGQAIATIAFAPFYKHPGDERDEYGMFKRDDI